VEAKRNRRRTKTAEKTTEFLFSAIVASRRLNERSIVRILRISPLAFNSRSSTPGSPRKCCRNIPGAPVAPQFNPITRKVFPRFTLHRQRRDGMFIRSTETQSNCFWRGANGPLHVCIDFVSSGGVNYGCGSKVGGGALDAAVLARPKPFAWDGLAQQ